MTFKNTKIQKIISSLMIIAMLSPALAVFVQPKPAEAQFTDFVNAALKTIGNIFGAAGAGASVTNTSISIKNVLKDIAKQILTVVAKRALASMTKNTVNWINNGFHGSPLFIQNPQSFFKDITTSQIKDLISIVGYDPNRFPFGKQQALNIIAGYKSQLDTNAAYSLSSVTNDPTLLYNFRTNFSVGGWNGFILNTQYPQNNFIGSQMQINNQLALNLQGTVQAPAQKINTLLQQGAGFLSPQKCVGPNADAYNASFTNEFQKPTWQIPASIQKDYPAPGGYTNFDDPAYVAALQKYNDEVIAAQSDWASKNVCQGSLQNTTPGAVVASQITRALGESFSTSEIGIAVGGSLAAVFDSLLNKFLGSGLNSLASAVNPPPPTDNFSYDGQTLGSPLSNTNGSQDVFSGPDQEIVLDKFKKDVVTGIANTQAELKLIDNNDPSNYGITQMDSLIWPQARDLDICVPGPDIGWEDRLKAEMDRNSQKLQEKASDTDGQTAYRASVVLKELKFAVDYFKNWVQTEMIKSGQGNLGLKDSIIYIDAVNQVKDLDQQSSQLTDTRRAKAQTLARLQAIERGLAFFSTQPPPGSQAEKDLVTFKNQYDSIADSISNSTTIENTKTQLNTAIDQYKNLQMLTNQCTNERRNAGWTYITSGTWSDTLTQGNSFVSKLSGGSQMILKKFPSDAMARSGGFAYAVNSGALDKETEQFCGEPITYGYNHGSFRDPWQGSQCMPGTGDTVPFGLGLACVPNPNATPAPYPDLPLVNANKVFTYSSGVFGWGSSDVNITIDCNTVFRASTLDYKGDLPISPGLKDPVQPPPLDSGPVPGLNGATGTQTGTGSSSQLGTCTGSNSSTQTNVTQTACMDPNNPLLQYGSTGNTWTANSSSTNPGTVNPPPACGGAGQPACG